MVLVYAKYPSGLSSDWERWSSPPAGGFDFLYNPENITGIKANFRVIPAEIVTKRVRVRVGYNEEGGAIYEYKTLPDNEATAEFFKIKALEFYSPFSESFGGDMVEELAVRHDLRYGDIVTLHDDARGERYSVRVERETLNLSTSRVLHNFSLGTPIKNLKSEVSGLERRVF